jgi:Flp pilus assembly protein TadD
MSSATDALSKARFLLERGSSREARDVLAAAIAGGLDGAPVRSLMGLILHQLGDFPSCERELRQAVRLAQTTALRNSRSLRSATGWATKPKPKPLPSAPLPRA